MSYPASWNPNRLVTRRPLQARFEISIEGEPGVKNAKTAAEALTIARRGSGLGRAVYVRDRSARGRYLGEPDLIALEKEEADHA